MRRTMLGLSLVALGLTTGGCTVYHHGYAPAYVEPAYYEPAPVYAPAPVVYGPPAYYGPRYVGPSVSLQFGGGGRHHHYHHRRHCD